MNNLEEMLKKEYISIKKKHMKIVNVVTLDLFIQ